MQRKSQIVGYLGCAMLILTAGTGIAQERLAPVMAAQYAPTLSFGMIGLGTNATARLNVVNLVRTPPPIMTAIAQLPCKVELDVYDGQGKLVKQKTIANLGYGLADFLDVFRSDIGTAGTHVEIGAVVRVGSNQSYFCSVSPTLEVFDSVTGNTTAILTNTNTSPAFFWPPVLSAAPSQP